MRSYGEHVEEHIGNLIVMLKIHWELDGNFMGTFWEQQKSNTLTYPKRNKNLGPLGACYLTSLPARILFAYLYLSSLPFWVELTDKGMNYGCTLNTRICWVWKLFDSCLFFFENSNNKIGNVAFICNNVIQNNKNMIKSNNMY